MYRLFLLLSVFYCSSAIAQDSSSVYTRVDSVTTVLLVNSIGNHVDLDAIDTTLNDWHYYQRTLYNQTLNLGNFGSDSYDLYLRENSRPGFRFRIPYSVYYESLQNQEYFNTRQPLTSISYFNGSQEEQELRVFHSQNVLPYLNIGVDYSTLSSTGFYFRQRTEHKSARFRSIYNSTDGRYQMLANAVLNNSHIEENGGILIDSLFTDNIQPNRQGIPIHLSNAENQADNRGFSIDQVYQLLPRVNRKDSVTRERKVGASLRHSTSYEWQYNRFDDSGVSDSLFYTSIGLDTNAFGLKEFRDIRQWNHTAGIALDAGFEIDAILRYENTQYKDVLHSESYNSIFLEGGITGLKFFKTEMTAYVSFGLGGLNAGNYKIDADWDLLTDSSKWQAIATFKTSRSLPRSEFWIYGNEFFEWNYDPDEQLENEIGLTLKSKRLDLTLDLAGRTIDNLAYFSSNVKPEQFKNTITYGSISLEKIFHLGAFHIKAKGMYQYVNDVDSPIRVPAIWTHSGVYYENDLFKKALRLRFGADVTYFSKFKANRYLPINRTFLLQEDEEIGEYPFVDVYLTAQIKKVRVFVKMTHLNQSLTGFSYFNLPSYPHFDRMLRLGVNWIFLN